MRAQHVAGRGQRRHAVYAGHRQRRAPGAVEHQFGEVVVHRLEAVDHREFLEDLGIHHLGSALGLGLALFRNLHVHAVEQDAAGLFVFDARQQLAQQAEAGRHHAGGIARMHALVEHLHREVAAGQAAQRGGAPQLVIVGAARIQAHHQRRLADAVGQVVHVGRQVVAARFLTGFDQHHAARVRQVLFLQRQHRSQRAEDGVAVIGAAAAVQLVAAQHRHPRAEVVVPAGHLRLLVQVAVQQHGVVAGFGAGGGNFQQQQRRAAFQAHHFDLQARQLLRLGPGFHQGDGLLHVAVLDPIGVEHRRFVGNADVFDQLRNDLAVPLFTDELAELGAVHLVLRMHVADPAILRLSRG